MDRTRVDEPIGQLGVALGKWIALLHRLRHAATAGGQPEQPQWRTGDHDAVIAAVAGVEPELRHKRHSSTAATRSILNRVSSALPWLAVAARGSPRTPFGLTARTPLARSSSMRS